MSCFKGLNRCGCVKTKEGIFGLLWCIFYVFWRIFYVFWCIFLCILAHFLCILVRFCCNFGTFWVKFVVLNVMLCCRLFGMKRCARCQAAILFTEMVMRARDLVFHVHCFTCAVCNSTFTKGDQFGLKDGTVLCQIHYELAVSDEQHQSPSPATFPGGGTYPPTFPSPEFHPHHHHASIPPPTTPVCPDSMVGSKVPYFNGTATGTARQKGRPRKRKPKDLETMTANLGICIACVCLCICPYLSSLFLCDSYFFYSLSL